MTQTFFRIQPASRPVEQLLDESTWQCTVWSDTPAYRKCDTCRGLRDVYSPDFDDYLPCETCNGQGEVEDIRYGVSACVTMERLYNYFAGRDGNLDDCVVVELEADFADDDDFDTEDGADLVYPRRIISVRPLDDDDRAAIEEEEQR